MANLTDIDNVAPAHSLKAGADVLNTWRARLDELHQTLGLGSLTATEVTQLQAIGITTISAAQWGYLGACVAGGGQLLAALTTAESTQLEAIGTTTITATQWGYLGACTAAGGAILDDADASAQRTTMGLAIGTDVQAYDAELAALAGLTSAADKLPYFTGSGTATVTTLTTFARSILDDANEATFKATVNLEIGTDVLAYDVGLSNLAGIAMAADKFYYTSADNTHVAGTVTTFGRSIIDDADEATFKATVNLEIGTDVLAQQTIGIADNNLMEVDDTDAASTDYARFTATGLQGRDATEVKTDLGLVIGTNVQAYDAQLADIAALAVTDGNFIVGDGANWVVESGTTALASLGLVAELDNLTSGEVGQLEAIGTTTISAAQWGYLGGYEADSMARAYRSGTQSDFVNDTDTKILLNAESYDPGSNFDIGNSRYVAPVTGYYQVNGNVAFINTITDKRYAVIIYVNGAAYSIVYYHAAYAGPVYGSIADLVYLTSGQYIELYALSSSGDNTVDVAGTEAITFMSIFFVSD